MALAGNYSPAPVITIGIVGVADPCSGSTVIANALASTPAGKGGCGLARRFRGSVFVHCLLDLALLEDRSCAPHTGQGWGC